MIKWYDSLYVDEVLNKRLEKVKMEIETGKITFHVYCIALAVNEQNLFDIIHVNELLFQYYKRNEIKILGLVSSKFLAFQLIEELINEVYQETGAFDVRSYFCFA